MIEPIPTASQSIGTNTVLVTGSSRGIGRAIALALAGEGYDIVLHCRSRIGEANTVAARVEAIGRRARVLMFDVRDRDEAARTLRADMESHDAYYGVVCNAGIARDSAFPAMSGNDWDTVVHTNLDAFFNVLNPVVMEMVRRRLPGRIVTLSSVSGNVGNRGQVNYSASKAGIAGATKALAVELAKRGITCNCVAPGLIDTAEGDTAESGGLPDDSMAGSMNEHARAEALTAIPMRRLGKPHEVAVLVAFLMRPEAGYITRQVISVNGGMAG